MIYFVRHGESQANADNVFAGPTYVAPLTAKGRKQAQLAGQDIVQRKIHIDAIVASPIERAKDTAIIIAETIGYTGKISYDDRIREYDMGDLSGTTMAHVTPEMRITAAHAEDPSDFMKKVSAVLDDIRKMQGNVLIVSHAGVGRAIEANRVGLEPRRLFEIDGYPNAKVVVVL
jgi:probable phosphoglycerate mutase